LVAALLWIAEIVSHVVHEYHLLGPRRRDLVRGLIVHGRYRRGLLRRLPTRGCGVGLLALPVVLSLRAVVGVGLLIKLMLLLLMLLLLLLLMLLMLLLLLMLLMLLLLLLLMLHLHLLHLHLLHLLHLHLLLLHVAVRVLSSPLSRGPFRERLLVLERIPRLHGPAHRPAPAYLVAPLPLPLPLPHRGL
jgi:hypothetical protein